MKTNSSLKYGTLFVLLLLFVQFTSEKLLLKKSSESTTTTQKYTRDNGAQCDTNNQCKSGYCAYGFFNFEDWNNGSPSYSTYRCMFRFQKRYDSSCYYDNECMFISFLDCLFLIFLFIFF